MRGLRKRFPIKYIKNRGREVSRRLINDSIQFGTTSVLIEHFFGMFRFDVPETRFVLNINRGHTHFCYHFSKQLQVCTFCILLMNELFMVDVKSQYNDFQSFAWDSVKKKKKSQVDFLFRKYLCRVSFRL